MHGNVTGQELNNHTAIRDWNPERAGSTLVDPSIAVLTIIAFVVRNNYPLITRSIAWGALSGCIATAGPGGYPHSRLSYGLHARQYAEADGVLLLNQFMTGPTVLSNIAGWAYHFWNGAAFRIIYVLFLGTTRRWPTWICGLVIGIIFMLSPVVRALGIGYFGLPVFDRIPDRGVPGAPDLWYFDDSAITTLDTTFPAAPLVGPGTSSIFVTTIKSGA